MTSESKITAGQMGYKRAMGLLPGEGFRFVRPDANEHIEEQDWLYFPASFLGTGTPRTCDGQIIPWLPFFEAATHPGFLQHLVYKIGDVIDPTRQPIRRPLTADQAGYVAPKTFKQPPPLGYRFVETWVELMKGDDQMISFYSPGSFSMTQIPMAWKGCVPSAHSRPIIRRLYTLGAKTEVSTSAQGPSTQAAPTWSCGHGRNSSDAKCPVCEAVWGRHITT